ncbi:MAG: DUF2148 domain-containing protein [Methanomicrobiales archaeon]|nr:DUF2148 domain-containing protein [Methanomicrobiales archaeon]
MTDEGRAVEMVAELMALSARTAPKAKGMDILLFRQVVKAELPLLATAMRDLGTARARASFSRDAGNVERSDACFLIGMKRVPTAGLNCGACGFSSCDEMLRAELVGSSALSGPNCAIRLVDLGIALGSAVKTASIHNLDNRIMYSVGVAALSLGWLPDCTVALGIPLRASGKSIYFDRQV